MCGSYCHHSSYDPFVLDAKFQGHHVVPGRNRPNPKKGEPEKGDANLS